MPGMTKRDELIRLLADGARHSGAELASRMACSRTAVWKHAHGLESLGLECSVERGRGYALSRPLELFDAAVIESRLSAQAAVASLDIHSVTDSTSERARALAPPPPGTLRVVLAEYQTAGRGRRGRSWQSPYAGGVCLSVAWRFDTVPASLPALALAAGVSVCRALRPLEPRGLGLKWPNDILCDGGKLGGVLVDVQGESDGPLDVIVGIGMNVEGPGILNDTRSAADALPPAGLRAAGCTREPSRNALAAGMVDELHSMLTAFAAGEVEPYLDEWRALDRLRGASVNVTGGAHSIAGTATGIGDDGALLVDVGGEIRQIVSGDVTLRRAS